MHWSWSSRIYRRELLSESESVLIVEDHPFVSDGIAAIVTALRPSARVFQCARLAHAQALVVAQKVALVFLDLRIPDASGFQALEFFRALLPGTPIAVVSGEEENEVVMRCLQLGARAFVPKSLGSEAFRRAIEQVLLGGTYAPIGVIAQLSEVARVPVSHPPDNPWSLTTRQIEVATLLVDGMPNKLIANRLNISESTVKLHVSSILRQMRVTNRSQAVLLLARSGLKMPGARI